MGQICQKKVLNLLCASLLHACRVSIHLQPAFNALLISMRQWMLLLLMITQAEGVFVWAFSGFSQKKAAQTNQTARFGFVL
jgi:hypothetical protein